MSASAKKVLIVEDALSVGLAYQAWLNKEDFDSTHVTTGQEALDLLGTGEFKVVLLDLQLPDIGGMEISTMNEFVVGFCFGPLNGTRSNGAG